jgi:hypothetical protein
MARRFTYERSPGLPKNWPKVTKRIKKKYYDKANKFFYSLEVFKGLPGHEDEKIEW